MVRIDCSYRDEYFTGPKNQTRRTLTTTGDEVLFGIVDDVSLINMRVGLENETWQASLWGGNLTDESYLTDILRDGLGTLVYYRAEPRTYGIDLKYLF